MRRASKRRVAFPTAPTAPDGRVQPDTSVSMSPHATRKCRKLYIAERTVIDTWRALEAGARLGVESTVRWAGPAVQLGDPNQVVTTVLIPHQRVSAGGFEIPFSATRAMGLALSGAGLVNLAQIHTHPADWVGHSSWDDARAYSSREGALSIVLPAYGRRIEPVNEWGIHERCDGAWVQLSAAEAIQRIFIVPDNIDLRIPFELLHDSDVQDADEPESADGFGRADTAAARTS